MPPIAPFIETPSPRLVASATVGCDTLPFDRFRQGVELTTDVYRYLGLYRVSAGTTDHSLPQNEFGQVVELEPTAVFTDHEGFSQTAYMSGGLTLPFPLDEMRGGFSELLDGALEPLTIRLVAANAIISFPSDPHMIRADLQAGNADYMGRTDSIDQIRPVFTEQSSPFFDAQDTMGDVGLPGFVSDIATAITPLDDVRRILVNRTFPTASSLGSVPTLLRDIVMEELVMAVTGGLEPMLPIGSVSMPAGYSYDVPLQRLVTTSSGTTEISSLKSKAPFAYGTDSLAFGGLLQ